MSYTNTLSHTRFANGPSGQLGLLALDWYDTEHDFSGLGQYERRAPAHTLFPTAGIQGLKADHYSL